MKQVTQIALPLLVSSFFALAAQALPPAAQAQKPVAAAVSLEKKEQVIDQKAQKQELKIQKGVKAGQLTAEETKKLEEEQAQIKKIELKAQADGKITKKEMKKIARAQNQAEADIAKKKHNSKVETH